MELRVANCAVDIIKGRQCFHCQLLVSSDSELQPAARGHDAGGTRHARRRQSEDGARHVRAARQVPRRIQEDGRLKTLTWMLSIPCSNCALYERWKCGVGWCVSVETLC